MQTLRLIIGAAISVACASCFAAAAAEPQPALTFVPDAGQTVSTTQAQHLPVPKLHEMRASLQADGTVKVDCVAVSNPRYKAALEARHRNQEH